MKLSLHVFRNALQVCAISSILTLLPENCFSKPTTEQISNLLERCEQGTIADSYYFSQVYKSCITLQEVLDLHTLLQSEVSTSQLRHFNALAAAKRLSAVGEHKKGLKILRGINSTHFPRLSAVIRSEYFHAIGYIAMNSGNPKISLEYYQKAAILSSKTRTRELYQAHLSAIGVAYNANEMPEQALKYFHKAKLLEAHGENRNSLYLALNIALTTMNMGNLEQAKRDFLEAMPLIKARKDVFAEIRTLGNLGDIYFKQDSLNLAIKHLKSAQELALIHNRPLDLIRINSGLSQAFEKVGNESEALSLLKNVIQIESELNHGISNSLTELELKEEIVGQKKVSRSLRAQRDKEIQLKNYFFIALIALVVITVALLVYIIQFQKKKKQLLKRELSATKRNRPDNEKSQPILEKLEQIMLEQELFKQSGITMDQVARQIGTNRTYLSEAINVHYEKTFSAWLNGIRINFAKQLLADTRYDHLSVEGIAKTAGFASISTFNSNFKAEIGLTPSYFRKNANNQRGKDS
ncbi:MAG: helix-turn-helix domain-containing protein [Fluviicola sp.]